METDASNFTIGGVLWLKTDQNKFLPAAYKSCVLQATEQQYSICDKEFVAIIHYIKKWGCYLESIERIIVLNDHKSSYTSIPNHTSRVSKPYGWNS